MKDLIAFEKGVINAGDDSRIRQVMRRAANGEALTIAFLGGSITQGCLASTPEAVMHILLMRGGRRLFPRQTLLTSTPVSAALPPI